MRLMYNGAISAHSPSHQIYFANTGLKNNNKDNKKSNKNMNNKDNSDNNNSNNNNIISNYNVYYPNCN